MNKWILYVFTLGFAAYWASNLLLWFPWSYSSTLGITLMLTASPVLWAFVIFLALRTYPRVSVLKGAFIIAAIFLVLAAVLDYIFFGIIRNAMEELYHPTTFYGYAFLVFWPVILFLIIKSKITRYKRSVANIDIVKAAMGGLICFATLTLIILLDARI